MSVDPQELTRSHNKELLKAAYYEGPVQAWRRHADRWEQRRGGAEDSTTPSGSQCGTPVRGGVGNQRSWSAVVRRLYPYSDENKNKAFAHEIAQVSTRSLSPNSRCRASAYDTAGDGQDGNADSCTPPGTPRGGQPAPGTPGRRRYGRPPKATWLYLHEHGTKIVRERAESPQAPPSCGKTPKPLKHSQELLKVSGSTRRPLWSPRARTKRSPPVSTVVTQKPRSNNTLGSSEVIGRHLFERAERQRTLLEQRLELAAELKNVEEMRECTFQPQTNVARRPPFVRDDGVSLYDRALRQQWRKHVAQQEGAQRKCHKELSQCTFQPAICRDGGPPQALQTSFEGPFELNESVGASITQPSSGVASPDVARGFGFMPPERESQARSRDLQAEVLSMLEDWKAHQQMPVPGRQTSTPSRGPITPERTSATRSSVPVNGLQEPSSQGFAHVRGSPRHVGGTATPSSGGTLSEIIDLRSRQSGVGGAPRQSDSAAEARSMPDDWRDAFGSEGLPQTGPPPHVRSSKVNGGDEISAAASYEAQVLAMLEEWRTGRRSRPGTAAHTAWPLGDGGADTAYQHDVCEGETF